MHLFDHHCLLLRTCVGERNHPRFLSSVLLHALCLALYLAELIPLPMCGDCSSHPLLFPVALAGRAYFVIVTLAAVSLAGVHLFFAVTSSVSQEMFHGRAFVDFSSPIEPCDLPFSRGPCQDLSRFVSQDECCARARGIPWRPSEWKPADPFDRERTTVCDNPLNNKYYSCC